MSLEKAILSGKERRDKMYLSSSKFLSNSCKNHGRCTFCKSNRLYNTKKKILKSNFMEEEYEWLKNAL